MRGDYKKENGFYIIEAINEIYFMRNHPKDMYASMRHKRHDRFIAYTESGQSIEDFLRDEVVLTIEDLRNYIIKIEETKTI